MVIDASALIAYLLDETGADFVEQQLQEHHCLLSVVQRTEVIGKLVGSGTFTQHQVETRLAPLARALMMVPFDLTQSDAAAYFYARRSPYKLSLGDCACLALAETRGEDVLTAERGWTQLPDLRVKVHLIR